MKITITFSAPDDWRDETDDSGVLQGPYEDITEAMIGLGAEDIGIQATD